MCSAPRPDHAALDGFLGDAKSIDNLGFGALKSARLRPTATGHALDLFLHTAAATRPGTPVLASLSTGPLAAGDQYLVVLDGLVGQTPPLRARTRASGATPTRR